MNFILLIFFAFPLATIIFSIVLEPVLRNPVRVAAITFAIFLVITFAFFDTMFLIATLIYTMLSFVVAYIVQLVYRLKNNRRVSDDLINLNMRTEEALNTLANSNMLTNNSLNICNVCGRPRRNT